MVSDPELYELAERVGQKLHAAERRLVTAESCTAGWVAKALTDVPGSSHWFECGYVTYSDAAKLRDLGVAARTLAGFGAVSEQSVREMAAGALRVSGATVAVAVSGLAGPDGGTPGKAVGTGWFFTAARHALSVDIPTEPKLFGGASPAARPQAGRARRAPTRTAPPAGGQPLLLSFDHLAHWARAQILCALGTGEPEAAQAAAERGEVMAAGAPELSARLKNETAAAGFSPDLKPFRAHVTVARKVPHAPAALAVPPVLWRFDAFALIESRTDPGGPVYSVIESYLLVKAEKAHE